MASSSLGDWWNHLVGNEWVPVSSYLYYRGLQRPPFLGGVWHSAVIAGDDPSLASVCAQNSLGLVNASERSPVIFRGFGSRVVGVHQCLCNFPPHLI